ncbi:FAD-dependent oxidoreductase [Pedobacter aquatilis]|uniref:FAD-dependent oxidoreductase n=1 Tax=Pedobacter aquatilis TaxID=351343 RepID=UPI00292F3978|nr:FAD-dependent oxidoreductase [Pedobacter aquatilis]
MRKEQASAKRNLNQIALTTDLVIAGGGLSGVCTAITAARQGLDVVLVQDRPVLGGNSSSEVRLWVLGATSHMGNNNRWSREGGVIDEILVENTYRNPEGNPVIFDMILLDKVTQESKIKLILNTSVFEVEKHDEHTIKSIKGFCSQNSTEYMLQAPLFCDATGDGIIGFLSGAAFRMGAESKDEFDEGMAPTAEYGELLGHSLYFYSKDIGKPVKFVPPAFALKDITAIPRFRQFNANEFGCKLWWVEYGGRLDTVHDTEKIKWELWKVVYGIWNHIKNSGNFPEAENLTLEWVGSIPGKRESRRFEGDYILSQKDLINQNQHEDAVAYGGWSIDLHPADGIYSERPGCNQWHGKGVFQIPYRTLYSKNINNLFLAGRIISVSHVAFGATRVMATCAFIGQAVGMAAVICKQNKIVPKAIFKEGFIGMLQQKLLAEGHYIPFVAKAPENDLVSSAKISASSSLAFKGFTNEDKWRTLTLPTAQLFPLEAGKIPVFYLPVNALKNASLKTEIRVSERKGGFTPDKVLAKKVFELKEGIQQIEIDYGIELPEKGYVFLMFEANDDLQLGYTEKRVSGVLSVFNSVNKAVSNNGKQVPPAEAGVDEFEFWCPQRRPQGQNIAITASKVQQLFDANLIRNGIDRPFIEPNAWVSNQDDKEPALSLEWEELKKIKQIDLWFDTDFDHPMESVLMTHPENVMPFCIRNYQILDENGNMIFNKKDNYQTHNRVIFENDVEVKKLIFKFEHPSNLVPAAVFAIRCYPEINN